MSDTLVATPDPPEETPAADLVVEPEPEVKVEAVLCTPMQIIDHHLSQTRSRNTYASDEVLNILLDVRNSL